MGLPIEVGELVGQGLLYSKWRALVCPSWTGGRVLSQTVLTYGADLAISLYEKYRRLCQQQDLLPLPLDRIQGDIKPLLQHLDFRGRFRRRDLVALINQVHAKRSRIAPSAVTEYRPREANALADYFAGQASSFLLDRGADSAQLESPVDVPCDPPYDLLLEANAVILGPHQGGKTVLILQEMPGCDMLQMAQFAHWMDGKCAEAVKAIALATRQCKVAMSVEYVACYWWQRPALCQALLCPNSAQGPSFFVVWSNT